MVLGILKDSHCGPAPIEPGWGPIGDGQNKGPLKKVLIEHKSVSSGD